VTPGTPIKWLADGVISDGEYRGTATYGDYSINWSNDDDYVYIGIKARTAGWVAVGFGSETFMKNADIIMGSVKGGGLSIVDTLSTGEFGPHPPDTQLGGTDDILASAGKAENGYTVMSSKGNWLQPTNRQTLSKAINKIIYLQRRACVLTVKHSCAAPVKSN
jgi:hypothetical protein